MLYMADILGFKIFYFNTFCVLNVFGGMKNCEEFLGDHY